MNHKNMNHKPLDQKNLNWLFGISIIVLLVAISYVIGMVHWVYRHEVLSQKAEARMMDSSLR